VTVSAAAHADDVAADDIDQLSAPSVIFELDIYVECGARQQPSRSSLLNSSLHFFQFSPTDFYAAIDRDT
jgi:hypothetical protein